MIVIGAEIIDRYDPVLLVFAVFLIYSGIKMLLSEGDVIVINTCGFIGDAKQESVDTIMEMAELKKAGSLKKLIVTGCLAERYRESILQELPDVDAVLGVGSVHDIAQAVKEAFPFEQTEQFSPHGTHFPSDRK